MRQARREIDEVIAALKSKTDRIASQAARHVVTTGETGAVRTEARAAVEAVAKRFVEPVAERAGAGRPAARPPSAIG